MALSYRKRPFAQAVCTPVEAGHAGDHIRTARKYSLRAHGALLQDVRSLQKEHHGLELD